MYPCTPFTSLQLPGSSSQAGSCGGGAPGAGRVAARGARAHGRQLPRGGRPGGRRRAACTGGACLRARVIQSCSPTVLFFTTLYLPSRIYCSVALAQSRNLASKSSHPFRSPVGPRPDGLRLVCRAFLPRCTSEQSTVTHAMQVAGREKGVRHRLSRMLWSALQPGHALLRAQLVALRPSNACALQQAPGACQGELRG